MPTQRKARRPANPQQSDLPTVTRKNSILTRIIRQSLLLTTLPILLLGLLSFILARSILSQRILTQVAGMATFREDFIEESVRQERQHTALFATRADVRGMSIDAERAATALAKLHEELKRQNVSVRGLTLLSRDREALVSAGEASAPLLNDFAVSSIVLPVIDAKAGWGATDVYVPLVSDDGKRKGFLAVRYGTEELLESLFSEDSLGRDGSVTLGTERGGEIFILHHSTVGHLHSFALGGVDDPYLSDLPLTQAVQGEEGVRRARDERGSDVFTAYRYLPSLGWGMVVNVDAASALQGLSVLAISLAAIGALLLILSGYLGYKLAHGLTLPIMRLSASMQRLGPGKWNFQRSVNTGDEVEVLDRVVADLTSRLQEIYESLEDKVDERTEELRKESALDRAILETVDYGVVTMDAQGKVTDMNPSALRLLKREKKDCVGKKATDILTYIQRKRQCSAEEHPVTQALKQKASYRSHPAIHPNLVRADQSLLPVTFTVALLIEEMRTFGAIAVFQDMSEERQIDYMKSEFVSLASHQLRTPLSSIRWYVELLGTDEKKGMSPTQRGYFGEIEKASARMANLLEALLNVARLDGGAVTPTIQQVNLLETIGQMGEEWKITARERALKVTLSVPEKFTVRTDPVLLQIVLQNFFSNAFKYSTRGKEIIIRVRQERDHIIISVQDQGMGIPVSEQRRLFEKFFRAHNVRQMDTDGTGLGLYISKTIAEKLGGSIYFESQEGKGSTFTLVLPA